MSKESVSQDSDNRAGADPAKQLSLVLGSGGARGLAHIGVIRELEAQGYQIRTLSGCSMGALVGALYAAGKMEDYAQWVCGLNRGDILGLLDVTGDPGGFIAGRKLMRALHDWIGDIRIEELPIPYTAVAVDIEREKEVWLDEGNLYEAVRASISIPGVFTPYRYHGRVLVDGGLLNPIPVAPTINALTDLTFVVDANAPPTDSLPWSEQRDSDDDSGSIRFWLDRFLATIGRDSAPSASPAPSSPGLVDVLTRSLDTMQAAITRQHLAVFNPDRVFRIPRNLCMIHEFHRAGEIIEAGRQLARQQLAHHEDWQKALNAPGRRE